VLLVLALVKTLTGSPLLKFSESTRRNHGKSARLMAHRTIMRSIGTDAGTNRASNADDRANPKSYCRSSGISGVL